MKIILCSLALASAAAVSINSAIAFDLQGFIAQAQSCPIQTDADIDAKAKRLAGELCESKSCSSYGYRYDFCDKFSFVDCYQCD